MEQGQSRRDAFELAMRDHGYVVGKNLEIDYRWADGKFDRLHELAADFGSGQRRCDGYGCKPRGFGCEAGNVDYPDRHDHRQRSGWLGLGPEPWRPGGNVTGLSMDTGEEIFW